MPLSDEIDMSALATLVVAWRSRQNVDVRAVKAGEEVVEALREHAQEAVDKIATGQGCPYNPDDEQEAECPFLTADRSEVLDTALLEQLNRGASLRQASPDDMRQQTLALYAVLVGDDPDSRIAFVRRGNPVRLATKSVVGVFDQTLTRVQQPILAFDASFDVIFHGDAVWIMNQKNFEALFKESEAVLAKTEEWAESLNERLPLADDSQQWLAQRLRQNSVMRRKVQSILRSPYISALTPDMLRQKMTAHDLIAEDLMKDDALIFNKETEQDILLLLNEDLWTGDFSGEHYAAARKSRR
jgi:hypothetical protein